MAKNKIIIDTRALVKAEQKLKQVSAKTQAEIADEVEISAIFIQNRAIQYAPKNNGVLAGSIYRDKVNKYQWDIGSDIPYAPFMEFGTGLKVEVPQEWAAFAAEFKGTGDGGTFEDGLQAIKDWCNDKGINEDLAFVIFMDILKNGVEARPFLYPAFNQGRELFIKDLQNIFKNIGNE